MEMPKELFISQACIQNSDLRIAFPDNFGGDKVLYTIPGTDLGNSYQAAVTRCADLEYQLSVFNMEEKPMLKEVERVCKANFFANAHNQNLKYNNAILRSLLERLKREVPALSAETRAEIDEAIKESLT